MRTFVDAPQHFPEITQPDKGNYRAPAFANWLVQPRTWLTSEPIPRIDTSTTEPSFIDPTPIEVPTAITSPGINVMSRDSRLTCSSGEKTMSDNG